MFTIDEDEAAGVIHLTLTGFWQAGTVHALVAALLPVIARFQARPGGYHILSDSTDFPIQSPEVSAAFHQLIEKGAARTRGRTAIVVAGMLNKLQAQRVFRSPNIAVFLSRDEALGWLVAETVA